MNEPFRSPAYRHFAARVEQNVLLAALFLNLSIRLRVFLQASGESTKTFGLPFPVESPSEERRLMLEDHIETMEAAWNRFIGQHTEEEVHEAHDRFLDEMLLTRTVDALEAYLGAMLTHIFTVQPQHLTDADRKQLDGLTGDARSAKIEEVAEQRADSLARAGMDGIIEYLNNKMHVLISTKGDDLYRKANEYINVRHLIVHTDLKVTPRFLLRTQRQDLKKGQAFPFTHAYAIEAVDTLWTFVGALDMILIERLNLFANQRTPPAPQEDHGKTD